MRWSPVGRPEARGGGYLSARAERPTGAPERQVRCTWAALERRARELRSGVTRAAPHRKAGKRGTAKERCPVDRNAALRDAIWAAIVYRTICLWAFVPIGTL